MFICIDLKNCSTVHVVMHKPNSMDCIVCHIKMNYAHKSAQVFEVIRMHAFMGHFNTQTEIHVYRTHVLLGAYRL